MSLYGAGCGLAITFRNEPGMMGYKREMKKMASIPYMVAFGSFLTNI
jgi:hypothetical protein